MKSYITNGQKQIIEGFAAENYGAIVACMTDMYRKGLRDSVIRIGAVAGIAFVVGLVVNEYYHRDDK